MSELLAPNVNPKTGRRAELTAEILRLKQAGLTHREIAAELGIGKSTVSSYISDPDGSKDKRRKERYRGSCRECGRPTAGGNGPNRTPEFCRACARKELRQSKYWTRERVIDAIQRFAAEHGRPPTADEWISASPEHGYPPRSSVYRAGKRSSSPFVYWADAIEAAGFPRPTSGRRSYSEVHMAEQDRTGYVILRQDSPDEGWRVVGMSEAHSQVVALNEALNGHEPTGMWVAVPGRFWRPRGLKPRTVYDWAEETETA